MVNARPQKYSPTTTVKLSASPVGAWPPSSSMPRITSLPTQSYNSGMVAVSPAQASSVSYLIPPPMYVDNKSHTVRDPPLNNHKLPIPVAPLAPPPPPAPPLHLKNTSSPLDFTLQDIPVPCAYLSLPWKPNRSWVRLKSSVYSGSNPHEANVGQQLKEILNRMIVERMAIHPSIYIIRYFHYSDGFLARMIPELLTDAARDNNKSSQIEQKLIELARIIFSGTHTLGLGFADPFNNPRLRHFISNSGHKITSIYIKTTFQHVPLTWNSLMDAWRPIKKRIVDHYQNKNQRASFDPNPICMDEIGLSDYVHLITIYDFRFDQACVTWNPEYMRIWVWLTILTHTMLGAWTTASTRTRCVQILLLPPTSFNSSIDSGLKKFKSARSGVIDNVDNPKKGTSPIAKRRGFFSQCAGPASPPASATPEPEAPKVQPRQPGYIATYPYDGEQSAGDTVNSEAFRNELIQKGLITNKRTTKEVELVRRDSVSSCGAGGYNFMEPGSQSQGYARLFRPAPFPRNSLLLSNQPERLTRRNIFMHNSVLDSNACTPLPSRIQVNQGEYTTSAADSGTGILTPKEREILEAAQAILRSKGECTRTKSVTKPMEIPLVPEYCRRREAEARSEASAKDVDHMNNVLSRMETYNNIYEQRTDRRCGNYKKCLESTIDNPLVDVSPRSSCSRNTGTAHVEEVVERQNIMLNNFLEHQDKLLANLSRNIINALHAKKE